MHSGSRDGARLARREAPSWWAAGMAALGYLGASTCATAAGPAGPAAVASASSPSRPAPPADNAAQPRQLLLEAQLAKVRGELSLNLAAQQGANADSLRSLREQEQRLRARINDLQAQLAEERP